ncbi:hypothetical protein VNO78_10897 [Psophocarpus tetragonolobus]|uniref:Molybdopterin cofactor biosynthesis C (MoaC) domain-containing protein n=1 Tax=Psophocarpus tetragonolobus TaxID=3891 RepID=A0AAN9SLH0_PSOTE
MESVFGELPANGLASSASNSHVNSESHMSSPNIGESSSVLTHTGKSGEAQMKVFDLVSANQMAKGDVLRVAKIAGISAAKQTTMTVVSVASLTVYDMCKAASKDITITDIRLKHESGEKS